MKKESKNPLLRASALIVQKRMLFFLLFLLATIFSVFSASWVQVENELTAYLDEDTNTRIGLDLMDAEFTTFATAKVMVCNIDYPSGQAVAQEIESVEGVDALSFDQSSDHYQNGSALLSITFDGVNDNPVVLAAMDEIRGLIAGYDVAVDTTVGVTSADTLAAEMQIIMVVAVLIIVTVLLFTSKSYGEIPVFLLTFGVAALVNKGTNFIFGEISFVSNSVAIILQLALAIDYAIILSHRYAEERCHMDATTACTVALSKAIVEISSSSLTTVSGLLAMSFMSFGLGGDLAWVLIKSIVISLLCVFTLMPGLLVLFDPLIEKTKHKNLVPSIAWLGKFAIKTRYVIPPLFLILAVVAAICANQTQYLFSAKELRGTRQSQVQLDADRIAAQFGSTNGVALIVPSGDYEKEAALLAELETYPEVDVAVGLANTEAKDGYMVTDALDARQFSELMDVDYEEAMMLYAAYAVDDEDYAKLINQTDRYALPLIDTVLFLKDMEDDGYFTLDEELAEELETQSQDIRDGQLQLESEDYSRLLISLNLPQESEETFAFLSTIETVAGQYYDEIHLVGDPTSNLDLSNAFSTDNLIIGILSALFVMAVLLFTFGSVAVPILLIVVIQSAIFMNFAFPYIRGTGLFFVGYLVVSAIQMGANVDYAIVITNRYLTLRKTRDNRTAIVQALDESFATILTSGTILAAAGITIEQLTTEGTIATIGECVGRGTLISMALVLFVLPQLLYLGTPLIDKSAFSVRFQKPQTNQSGKMQVDGHVKGYVSGYVDGKLSGTITGKVEAVVTNLELLEKEETP